MLLFIKVELWDLIRRSPALQGPIYLFLWKLQFQDHSPSSYRGATLPSQRVLLDRNRTEPPGILRRAVAKGWEQLSFSELPAG